MQDSALLPTHAQLEMPLLEVLREHGPMAPAKATELVADLLRLPTDVRDARKPMPGYSRDGVRLLQHRLRWVRQGHVKTGLVSSDRRAVWGLTEKGEQFCHEAKPGMMVTVFTTDLGTALWAEFQSGLALLDDACVQTVVSSPPYPIIGGRRYGTFTPDQIINLVEEMFVGLKPKLRGDGSIFLNLADVWEKGRPTRSLYQEKILLNLVERHGFHLCDKFHWFSSTKPACSDWVTKRRERVRSACETFFWLAPTPHPKADNRQVLVPYGETMRRTLSRGGDRRIPRPSGHGHKGASYSRDNGGAIPPNYFNIPNAASNTAYHRYCRAMELPLHPARFPAGGALEFLVKLTTQPGDLVVDCFAGSQQLADVCERNGRRWFTTEKDLRYVRGGEAYFRGVATAHFHGISGEPRAVLPLP